MMLIDRIAQDPNQTLKYALILAVGTNLIMAVVQYFLQDRQLKSQTKLIQMQLESASENVKKQLDQSEKNTRIQLLHADQKESVNALWSILYNLTASDLKEKLNEFLYETPEGYYLPDDIQKIIRNEISAVNRFILEKSIELGMIDPEQDLAMIQEYDIWYSEMDQIERANIDTKKVYDRFEARIKEQIRKYTSISE